MVSRRTGSTPAQFEDNSRPFIAPQSTVCVFHVLSQFEKRPDLTRSKLCSYLLQLIAGN
ncbi:hypothetical protein BDV09DRAFT_160565 [Aspergillus tetrazonus]